VVQANAYTHSDGEAPASFHDPAWQAGTKKTPLENTPEIGAHAHDHLELQLIVSGRAIHRTQHYVTPVERGDMILIAPGQPHAFERIDGMHRIACVCLSEWFMHGSEDLWGAPGLLQLFLALDTPACAGVFLVTHHRLSEGEFAVCFEEMRAMALEVEREDPSLLYLRRCMDKLMLTVGRSYAEDEESGSFGWLSHPIMQALKIIENHAASNEPLRVSQLAGQCGLSPGYFSREFRKAVGSSPSQYFQRRRIQHASWLLLHTRQSISEIAYSLGFADVSHFERVFHVRRMMTPLAYRQRFVERAR